MPNTSESDRSKSEFLREEGTLNPAAREGARSKVSRKRVLRSPRSGAGEVRDAAPCFHRERAVAQVVQDYGVSRPTYYQAKANFERAGIAGLVPKKRGPAARTSSRATCWRF